MKTGKINWKLLIHTTLCILLMTALVLGFEGVLALREEAGNLVERVRIIPDRLQEQEELIRQGEDDYLDYDRGLAEATAQLISAYRSEITTESLNTIARVTDLVHLTLFNPDGSIQATTLTPEDHDTMERVTEMARKLQETGTDTEEVDDDLSLIWYSRTLEDGRIYISAINSSDIAEYRKTMEEEDRVLSRMMEDMPGSIYVINPGKVTCWPEQERSDQEMIELEAKLKALETDGNRVDLSLGMSDSDRPVRVSVQPVDGRLSVTVWYQPKDTKYELAAVLPFGNVTAKLGLGFAMAVLTASVMIAWILYCRRVIYVQPGEKKETRELRREASGKARPGLTVAMIILLVMALFFQVLNALDSFTTQSEDNINWMRSNLDALLERQERTEKNFGKRNREKAGFISEILSQDKTWLKALTKEDLALISRMARADYTIIFDENGNELLSDGNWQHLRMTDKTVAEFFEPFRSALKGGGPYLKGLTEDPMDGEKRYFVAVTLHNTENQVIGCIVSAFSPSQYLSEIVHQGMRFVMDQAADYALILEDETGKVTFSMLPDKAEKKPITLGATKERMEDSYDGMISLDGRMGYLSIFSWNYQTVITLQFQKSLVAVFYRFLMMALLLILLTLIYYPGMFRLVLREKIREAAELSPAERKTEEENSTRNSSLEVFPLALSAAICALTILSAIQSGFIPNSLANRLMSRRWAHSFNIYSLTYAIMISCLINLGIRLFRRVLIDISHHLSLRGETICRLLGSMLTYLGMIVILFYDLSLMGVSAPTLLTSAGILSLVVGMGANSLIADVVAGLFMIFEGNIQVGDHVEMGNWNGVVQCIGIRTTTFLTNTQDVKIINNSRIVDMTNKSKSLSTVTLDLMMPGNLSLPEVEASLESLCKQVTRRCRRVHGHIRAEGLIEAKPDGYLMRVSFDCTEKNREKTTMKVRREFYLLMHPEKAGDPVANAGNPTQDVSSGGETSS